MVLVWCELGIGYLTYVWHLLSLYSTYDLWVLCYAWLQLIYFKDVSELCHMPSGNTVTKDVVEVNYILLYLHTCNLNYLAWFLSWFLIVYIFKFQL